ncbi:MAG: c-type cytochrome [Gaiellaceae bacterium]
MRRPVGAALVVLALAGCGGTGGLAEEGSVSQGQQLFAENCASCHTLAHAKAQANIGPSLDGAFQALRRKHFDDSTIREIVSKQIKYPITNPPTGAPGMPANIVEGDDADAVASYVACVAGRTTKEWEKEGCGQPRSDTGGGGTDGKSIFASAGCDGCHTLKAAGASGTVGPNLDELSMDLAGAIKQITNGGGAMPAFGDRLKPDQIDAVAKFVVESRGK